MYMYMHTCARLFLPLTSSQCDVLTSVYLATATNHLAYFLHIITRLQETYQKYYENRTRILEEKLQQKDERIYQLEAQVQEMRVRV